MRLHYVSTLLLLPLIPAIPELSSKTVYDAVRGDIRTIPPPTSPDGSPCMPDRIYHLLRHGSRNFGGTIMGRIYSFLDKFDLMVSSGAVTLSANMQWYHSWEKGVYYPDYELVAEGMMEHYTIAERFKEKFPHLYPAYSVANYSLQATTKMRTIQSGLSYMDGILHNTGPLEASKSRLAITMTGYMPPGIRIDKNDEDTLLRPVDCCPKYAKYIDTLQWKAESSLFEAMPVFKNVVTTVSGALSYKASMNDTKALYYLCAAELMSPYQAKHSQFCNVFNQEAFELLDFEKDLEKYYKYSYPFPTTYKMMCLLLTDIVDELSKSAKTPVLKFAHEETVLPLLTLLGLFDDGMILKHTLKNWRDRKMKVSRIAPFAANVAFIKHACAEGSDPIIQVVVNEKVVDVPGCSPGIGCTIPQLRSILHTRSDGCHYASLCDIPDPDPPQSQFGSVHVMAAALLTIALCQATYIFFHCCKRCPMRGTGVQFEKIGDHQQLLFGEADELYAESPEANLNSAMTRFDENNSDLDDS